MKTKRYFIATLAVFALGGSLFRGIKTLAGGELPEVEYWAVCRDLPANAHWTGDNISADGLRKEIRQKEASLDVWGPFPSSIFYEDADPTAGLCTFVCDDGYEWDDGQTCVSSFPAVGITTGTGGGIGYITVSDGQQFYTIMDRNLGASVAGTGCGSSCWDPSYGDYFQRGNNHGFPSSGSIALSGTSKPDATGFGPGNYYDSGYYVKAGSDWSLNRNDNLRGGSGDTQTNRQGKDADRQGPCPAGYHVPSAWEWGGLLQTRYNVNSGAIGATLNNAGTGLPSVSTGTVGRMFMDDFMLPLAGYRRYDSSASVASQGAGASYWASSPDSAYGRRLYFNSSIVDANDSGYRAYGFSLRCFKNAL